MEAEPCGTVTLDGNVASAGDELSPTETPPLEAAPNNVTVQVVVVGGVSDTALHVNPFKPFAIVIVPAVAEIGSAAAVASAALPVVS